MSDEPFNLANRLALTVAEAAQVLGVSERHLRSLLHGFHQPGREYSEMPDLAQIDIQSLGSGLDLITGHAGYGSRVAVFQSLDKGLIENMHCFADNLHELFSLYMG